MDEIKTWADFGALTKEQLDGYTPEDLESLKSSIAENEAKIGEERKKIEEEAKKAREIAENQRIRAEKAEKQAKENKSVEQLSAKDILALKDIHDDDIDTVLEHSKLKGISVAEVKKDPYMASYLKTRAEERATANATNTGKSQRGTNKVSGEDLLERAETTGEVPEDEEGLRALFQARLARKIRKH